MTMGTITGQAIADKCEIILQDSTNIRWSESELLGWINWGQREIVHYRPDASVSRLSKALAAGAKQTLPATGQRLYGDPRNMGSGGGSPGRVVTLVDRETLDAYDPDWQSGTDAATIKHYLYDEKEPTIFFVYPPADGTTYLELPCVVEPAELASLASTITLDDSFEGLLIDCVLYRAFSKDADYLPNQQRAAIHQNAYMQSLTGKSAGDQAMAPKVKP
jgi:hypothetical protein